MSLLVPRELLACLENVGQVVVQVVAFECCSHDVPPFRALSALQTTSEARGQLSARWGDGWTKRIADNDRHDHKHLRTLLTLRCPWVLCCEDQPPKEPGRKN